PNARGTRLAATPTSSCAVFKWPHPLKETTVMKRTLTAFTAAIFASALAIPAFAQVGISGDADVDSSSSSSVNESTRHEYRAVEPAPMGNSVERSEHEYRHSERTE